MSTEEFEADKSSLRRMLTDFEHDNAKVQLHAGMHKIACTSTAICITYAACAQGATGQYDPVQNIGAEFVVFTLQCYSVFHSSGQHNFPLTAKQVSGCPKDLTCILLCTPACANFGACSCVKVLWHSPMLCPRLVQMGRN